MSAQPRGQPGSQVFCGPPFPRLCAEERLSYWKRVGVGQKSLILSLALWP